MDIPIQPANLDFESQYKRIVQSRASSGNGKTGVFQMEVIRIPTAPCLAPEDLRAWDRARNRLVVTSHSAYRSKDHNHQGHVATDAHMLDTHNDDVINSILYGTADTSSLQKISTTIRRRVPKEGMPLSQILEKEKKRRVRPYTVHDNNSFDSDFALDRPLVTRGIFGKAHTGERINQASLDSRQGSRVKCSRPKRSKTSKGSSRKRCANHLEQGLPEAGVISQRSRLYSRSS